MLFLLFLLLLLPNQSQSVGIANNSLKCPVYLRIADVNSKNKLIIRNMALKGTELIELAHKSKPFHLKLFKNDPNNIKDLYSMKDSLELNFWPNFDLLGKNLQDSFNNDTICHYETFDSNGFHNTLSACSIENFVAIIRIQGHPFILEYDQDKGHFFLTSKFTNSCEWPKFKSRRSQPAKYSIPTKIPSYYSKYLNDTIRDIKLILIADTSMYEKYDKDEKKVHERLQTIANIANSLYNSLNIRITLVWTDIWKTKDKILISNSTSEQILLDFLHYRKTILSPKYPNDIAYLITGKNFSPIFGKASIGTMCSKESLGGMVVDQHMNPVYIGSVLAHEIGHNLGMEHDSGVCECEGKKSCIMDASGSYNVEDLFFSNCSLNYMQDKFKVQIDHCLNNVTKKDFRDYRTNCQKKMSLTITNQPIPYEQIIQLLVDSEIIIYGKVLKEFVINFNFSETELALHLNVRYNPKVIVFNSKINNRWNKEERMPNPMPRDENFLMNFFIQEEFIYVHIFEYNLTRGFKLPLPPESEHRLREDISILTIKGDVKIYYIHIRQ